MIGLLSIALVVLGSALADARARLAVLESDGPLAPSGAYDSGDRTRDVEIGTSSRLCGTSRRDTSHRRDAVEVEDRDPEDAPDSVDDMSRGLTDLEIGGD